MAKKEDGKIKNNKDIEWVWDRMKMRIRENGDKRPLEWERIEK